MTMYTKPLWINNPTEWRNKKLSDQAEYLRKYHCTGPCGQSSQVMSDRSILESFLKEVKKLLIGQGL